MRDLIVHGHEAINLNPIYTVVSTRLDDFRRFRDEIDRATQPPPTHDQPI